MIINLIVVGAALLVIVILLRMLVQAIRDPSQSKAQRRREAQRKYEAPEKRAGRTGEQIASHVIESVLREDDHLLTNVPVSYDGKDTELDNVIVNSYGVSIIEVKTYKGRLYGEEDDYEWIKYKDDGYGNTFERKVKNPFRQVKRQIYILARHLNCFGIDVWVEGYAILLYNNSPVESLQLLRSAADIDRVIHIPGRNRLSAATVDAAVRLLEDDRAVFAG